jgi:hypothetical protein
LRSSERPDTECVCADAPGMLRAGIKVDLQMCNEKNVNKNMIHVRWTCQHAGELSNTAGRCSLVAVSEGRRAEGRGMATLDTRSKNKGRPPAHTAV